MVTKAIMLAPYGRPPMNLNNALTDVFVTKLVAETHALRLMLHRFSINDSLLELLGNRLVNGITLYPWSARSNGNARKRNAYKVLYSTPCSSQYDWLGVVRLFALRLCVYSYKLELVPPLPLQSVINGHWPGNCASLTFAP